jgi:hypothetical protein
MGQAGAKSYDGEKAWSSVNYSILSGTRHTCCAYLGNIWTLGYVFCGSRYTVKKCQISMCFVKETCRVFIYLFTFKGVKPKAFFMHHINPLFQFVAIFLTVYTSGQHTDRKLV